MSPEEAFKLGFLSRCVEENLPADRIELLAKQASSAFDKEAVGPAAAAGYGPLMFETLKNLPESINYFAKYPSTWLNFSRDVVGAFKDVSPALLFGAAAPPLVGGLAAGLNNVATDIGEDDVEEAKQQELVDTYTRLTDQLKRQQLAREFKSQRKKDDKIYM